VLQILHFGTKVPEKGKVLFYFPDLKVGAIFIKYNGLRKSNSPVLQHGEKKFYTNIWALAHFYAFLQHPPGREGQYCLIKADI
jgi:hypothetical protein